MTKRAPYRAKVVAATADRQQRPVLFALALLIAGLLMGQLLLLISP